MIPVVRVWLLAILIFGLMITSSANAATAEKAVDLVAKPAAIDSSTTPSPTPSEDIRRNDKGEPLVTNVFSDTDIRQALADIATQTGVMIVPDVTVQGTVSADLKDVPLEQALDIVLRGGGLSFAKLDGYYLVGAADPANPNFYLLTRTEMVELKYVTPQVVMSLLGTQYTRYLSAEGVAPPVQDRDQQRDRPANYRPPQPTPTSTAICSRLVITAPPSVIQRIKADIALLDYPPTQIMLEAAVIEVSDEALMNVGIDWATRWFRFSSKENAVKNGDNTINTPASSLTYSTLSNTEMVTLTALVENGKARLRANPRVATTEGQVAEIEVGKESYFAIVTGPVSYPYTTLEQIKSGILLRISPRALETEGEIVAQVEPEVRDVTGRGQNGLPEITFRRASTNIRVKDGQSIIIGGLINEFTTKTRSKVPLLGDIPLLGNLFRNTSSRQTKTEVVIVITPHILDATGSYTGQPGVK